MALEHETRLSEVSVIMTVPLPLQDPNAALLLLSIADCQHGELVEAAFRIGIEIDLQVHVRKKMTFLQLKTWPSDRPILRDRRLYPQ